MATYFHGAPEIQQDGLQTLYLMNPSYEGYSDGAPPPSGMVYLNPAANSLNSIPITQNFQSSNHQHHLVGIPLQPMMSSHDSGHPSSIPTSQQVTAVHRFAPRLHYNLWTPAPSNNPIELPSPSQQGLSLSLSPHQAPYAPYKPEAEFPATPPEVKVMGSSSSSTMSGLNSVLMGSKYLKAAQLLLDEVVSVGNGTQGGSSKRSVSKSQTKRISEAEGVDQVGTSEKGGANLTTADRQELQTKKAKLVGMLDEVEQRYQHYRQQMQILVSSFEAVAGFGSARTYTALALQTISKQFQCLREAISGQIRATSKSLGEEDFGAGGTKSTVSRLRFVDHQLRQQRAIQQLGMIQHNAWRPQRGLPERAVSVLRAWLFEHFLHPYPKDADKHMLARQTGLTRGQVSNWFINARVRLWKPMVEEMYMEEFKDQEQSNADGSASKSDANEDSSANHERSPTRTEQTVSLELESEQNNSNDPIAPASSSITTPPSLKKTRWDHSASLEMKPDMNNRDFLMKFMEGGSRGGTTNHDGGFGAYSIGEVGRFDHEQFAPRYSTNGVSLTLGLPHSENLSLSGAQPPYLPTESIQLGRRLDMSSDLNDYNPATSHPPNAYDSLNIQNRKRFSSLLLPDFIA